MFYQFLMWCCIFLSANSYIFFFYCRLMDFYSFISVLLILKNCSLQAALECCVAERQSINILNKVINLTRWHKILLWLVVFSSCQRRSSMEQAEMGFSPAIVWLSSSAAPVMEEGRATLTSNPQMPFFLFYSQQLGTFEWDPTMANSMW